MRLEQSLVLNRYLHGLFGASGLEDLKAALGRIEEGAGPDGQSRFFHTLAGLKGLQPPVDTLREYDARIIQYEGRLAKARGSFAFKYFQYLSLLYTEVFLDRLTDDPQRFVRELNDYLGKLRVREVSVREFPSFELDDLRRLAFFMATGSGKTLLLHVNLWQLHHYLQHAAHPDAIVRRRDRHHLFDSVLLITPNEGLSQQHLMEFRRSGIDAALLVEDRSGQRSFGPRVKIIEIHKLAEEPSKDGVSILLDELGTCNLIFVDEGHKGTGSEARTWKTRQRRLSADGFLLEYSATFAQSIGAASRKVQDELLAEYGKSIVFDYSYRHFYDDGYGKDFRVLNLKRARESQAHDLLLGGLLTYYQQVRHFHDRATEYHPYNLERPLWVFLGSSVNAVYSREGEKHSDVAAVVAFLRRFLEDRAWAVDEAKSILHGESGFTDADTNEDLFGSHLRELKGTNPRDIVAHLSRDIFHGRGGLEVWELKNAEGELGLRVSAPEGRESPYFGVINIGDVSAFKKHLEEKLGIKVQEDRFTASLFDQINKPESRVNVLIGSKKFIEGWSSWRVSAMGLLNIGRGEGPQVIQLFGRGVRLKGKNWTLKRSSKLPEEGPHPSGLGLLETLFIFGWNADYIKAFRGMLEQEDVGRELRIPVRTLFDKWEALPVPHPKRGYDVSSETWTLSLGPLHVSVDLTPQLTAMAAGEAATGSVEGRVGIDFTDPCMIGLLDVDALYADLVGYKARRQYGNVFIPRGVIPDILTSADLFMLKHDAADPCFLHGAALRVLQTYLDRWLARAEREAEGRSLEPATLSVVRETIPEYYTVRVSSDELLKEIERLRRKPTELYQDGGKPLPRLHVDRHLFSPLLLHPKDSGLDEISVSPPGLSDGEERVLKDLRQFWRTHHNSEPYRHLEVHVLRNLPRVGVGFFRRSGFYPDFVLWLKDKRTKQTRVLFIEPHGLHHGGLSGNGDKIEALKELRKLSDGEPFRRRKVALDGYLLTETTLNKIPGAERMSWAELERSFKILRHEGGYVEKILKAS